MGDSTFVVLILFSCENSLSVNEKYWIKHTATTSRVCFSGFPLKKDNSAVCCCRGSRLGTPHRWSFVRRQGSPPAAATAHEAGGCAARQTEPPRSPPVQALSPLGRPSRQCECVSRTASACARARGSG